MIQKAWLGMMIEVVGGSFAVKAVRVQFLARLPEQVGIVQVD
jgi:hypothetical protein